MRKTILVLMTLMPVRLRRTACTRQEEACGTFLFQREGTRWQLPGKSGAGW